MTAACAFMIALGGFAVFPVNVNADVISTVDLTPEETLALYGVSIPAVYKSGDTWHNCTFSYGGIVYPNAEYWDFRGSYPTGYTSWGAYVTNAINSRTYLAYICSFDDAQPDGASEFQFVLSPSLDISGISYYRQNFLFTQRLTYPYNSASNVFASNTVSYSATPVVSPFVGGWDGYCYGYIEFDAWYETSLSNRDIQYQVIDCYLQNIVDGVEQSFSVSAQELHYGYSFPWSIAPDYDTTDRYYILLVQCPRVTDGYIIPQPETTSPDYSGQLSDIYEGIGANTTLLQAILAKLDLIYQQMQNSGLPSPTLTPAQTIPHDLQQYYSGIASGAPSASAINEYSGGAALIPFSSILSASGLGGLFGLLVGIACAGWVLTRGRGG